ncbi:TnsA endonuclease N-terminal domain-containing protein [Acinetobacter nectaris]|uniref:TnsA endonuclease N-terminal domain-containing protein n=1 Tax=Acinetobacter nectaris TaxID=1219382 RepID=UPI001F4205B7|nr:TnsA endonuclease N-terminal domain-containing protein [Acinetobacter nectaris]MCF9046104.1 heteromeric transposase endonuclease subunit TnsA [Acinetobacter nectaris]
MANFQTKQSHELKIQKWIKEGRGQGFGNSYKPWITIRDVSSEGRSHRVFGHKCQRTHHLLSDLELSAFLLLEWHSSTIDIREQYPLDLEQTLEIAKTIGIPHPRFGKHHQIMTSDFLVDTHNSITPKFVVQVKYSNALNDPRTIEKIEIERQYWKQQNIPFYIFTEHQIPKTVSQNIQWLYSSINTMKLNEQDTLEKLTFYANIFSTSKSKRVNEIARNIDQKYHFEIGQSLREIRDLLAQRYFIFDLNISFKDLNTDHILLGEFNIWNEVLHAENQ